ncbi:DMT family transporter [Hoeflea sp. TYP-13]|uniref:DMT family transporter n=1 Tax=Hoeflea sp. TYP-13 TaxID=3230023 RepID=UPI0034C648AD
MTSNVLTPSGRSPRLAIAYVVMALTPLFFSTNIIFGRVTVPEVAPFTLAFLRWSFCALILLPFVFKARREVIDVVRREPLLLLLLGFLGMWISGAGVYYSLQHTTATNGTLIYTTSPLMIILLERVFFDRTIRWRELGGMAVAFVGVAAILFQGSFNRFLSGSLNVGDVGFVLAAVSWAGYSILFRSGRLSKLPIMSLFGLVCAAGALLLLPFALFEFVSGAVMPVTGSAWQGIAGIVVFSSLLAFSGFQYGLRTLGASLTGIFMYLLPPYGVLLAVLFLGEKLQAFHVAGILLVLGGVSLATFPAGKRSKKIGVPES